MYGYFPAIDQGVQISGLPNVSPLAMDRNRERLVLLVPSSVWTELPAGQAQMQHNLSGLCFLQIGPVVDEANPAC